MRIGVDVGGTNTDAVLLDGTNLLGAHKTSTTFDVETGVVEAIGALLQTTAIAAGSITSVMIGTTQFTNAFVERRRLVRIGVIRLAAPASTAIPPLYDWPADLLAETGTEQRIIGGGYEFDGREITPLDEAAVEAAALDFRAKGLTSVAISSAFAPLNSAMEERAAAIVREGIPGVRISLSSTFGRMGLVERENATAMNASLADLAERVVRSFGRALHRLGITAPLFISQNDGTLMSADDAERYPVLTFASGPTNSMRGAAYLSGLEDAIVIDIGGTTTDIGCLVHSFPRESSIAVDIGGVRTNFRMPDLVSIGLGGGSLVQFGDKARVGPRSVGYELTTRARSFGGDVLTATDITVAAGAANIGDHPVTGLTPDEIEAATAEIHRLVDEGVDRMRTSRGAIPFILVGGGAVLITRPLAGGADPRVPAHSNVANAVGAAIAQIGGEVDRLFDFAIGGREASLTSAKAEALGKAVRAGAAPESLRIVEMDEIPVGYLPGQMVRVRVKVVGDLALAATGARP